MIGDTPERENKVMHRVMFPQGNSFPAFSGKLCFSLPREKSFGKTRKIIIFFLQELKLHNHHRDVTSLKN